MPIRRLENQEASDIGKITARKNRLSDLPKKLLRQQRGRHRRYSRIISRLDYLKDPGADTIWISPLYKSPMADQKYDISDSYQIEPIFGTMEDMDRLLDCIQALPVGEMPSCGSRHCDLRQ